MKSLTREHIQARIPAHTFLKFKELANGDFERVKARTVAGGNQVDPDTVGETRAPTVGIVSVMAMISLATSIGFSIRTADIEGAFLIPELKPDAPRRHIYVDRIMSQRYIERHNEYAKYVDAHGKLTLELRKYLYGLPEAAYEFYMYMKAYLEKEGFTSMLEDPCCFQRRKDKDVTWICLLVDDLLVFGKDQHLDLFMNKLSRDFKIKQQSGESISYIGLDIRTLDNGDRIVAQGGCRKRILDRFSSLIARVQKSVKIVSDFDVFKLNRNRSREKEVSDNTPINERAKTLYLSGVMSVMFLSRLTRYDMLFWNSYLATRSKAPTVEDMRGLADC